MLVFLHMHGVYLFTFLTKNFPNKEKVANGIQLPILLCGYDV